MAEVFKKEIFSSNVNYLSLENGIKISDLEKQVGISAGYLTKLSKDNGVKPSIDLVMKIAERFKISIDTLVSVEMAKLSSTENYLIGFLEKLKRDTEAERLQWGKETAADLNHLNEFNCPVPHPFLTFTEDGITIANGAPCRKYSFVSNTFGTLTAFNGASYYLRINNVTLLFLANVGNKKAKVNVPEYSAKEVWIKTKTMKCLCTNKQQYFDVFIDNLFSAVAEHFKHLQLEQDYLSSIDLFMKNEAVVDLSEVKEFFPEELKNKPGNTTV